MALSDEDLRKIEQIIDKKLADFELKLIRHISKDKIDKLKNLQEEYLKRDWLTLKEISDSQLIGRCSKKTILKKMQHCSWKDENKYKVLVEGIVQYRETFGKILL